MSPDGMVSEEYLATLTLLCKWRTMVQDRSVFAHYFLPLPEDGKDVQFLRQGSWRGRSLDNPGEIIHQVDQLIFNDSNATSRKDIPDILGLEFREMAGQAWNGILLRDGIFRYLIQRLLGLFGRRSVQDPEKNRPMAPIPKKTEGQRPQGPALASTRKKSATAKPPKTSAKTPAQDGGQTALFHLIKNISDIDGEIEELFKKWNTKLGNSGALFRKKVDAVIIKDVAPRFSFATMTADQGEATALGLIAKNRVLNEVPQNKHRALARYIFLVALRHRLKNL
jgi:hypothetical protein